MTSVHKANTAEIVFVHVNSETGTKTGKQAAKAHTAHINWQRHRQLKRDQTSRRREHVTDEEQESEELNGSAVTSRSRSAGSSADCSRPSAAQASLCQPARSLSPTFGALETATFSQTRTGMTSRVAEHCLKVMWPEFLYTENTRAAWFQAFCKHPIIFHGFHCAAAVHADSLAGVATLSSSQEILRHKDKALHLLNKMISAPDFDMDLVMHAILPLTHIEMLDLSGKNDFVLPFSPHFPSAGWPRIFGDIVAFGPHVQALGLLVRRIGGLRAIEFPGLGSVLALCDLISSSIEIRKPAYSCFWKGSLARSVPLGFMRLPLEDKPGRGFSVFFSDEIHREYLETFTELAKVDAEMMCCRHRRLSEQDYRTLIFARNAAQHRLFSLESRTLEIWQSPEQHQDLKLGEICRLSAMLYANSVMFPLPPSRPWRQCLLEPLTNLLNDFDIQHSPHRNWQVLAWSACVAALAAGDLQCYKDLEKTLQTMLLVGRVSSFEVFHDVLSQYLWSPEACNPALAALWDRLTLEDTDLGPVRS